MSIEDKASVVSSGRNGSEGLWLGSDRYGSEGCGNNRSGGDRSVTNLEVIELGLISQELIDIGIKGVDVTYLEVIRLKVRRLEVTDLKLKGLEKTRNYRSGGNRSETDRATGDCSERDWSWVTCLKVIGFAVEDLVIVGPMKGIQSIWICHYIDIKFTCSGVKCENSRNKCGVAMKLEWNRNIKDVVTWSLVVRRNWQLHILYFVYYSNELGKLFGGFLLSLVLKERTFVFYKSLKQASSQMALCALSIHIFDACSVGSSKD